LHHLRGRGWSLWLRLFGFWLRFGRSFRLRFSRDFGLWLRLRGFRLRRCLPLLWFGGGPGRWFRFYLWRLGNLFRMCFWLRRGNFFLFYLFYFRPYVACSFFLELMVGFRYHFV
jgi:hypothetical protein